MLGAGTVEMPCEGVLDDAREHGDAVLVALAAAYHDLVASEVDVLDAQATALQHTQPGAVEETSQEAGSSVQPLHHRADLLAREDHGQPLGPLRAYDAVDPGQIDPQHVLVQEEQRAQCLVLEAATLESTARAVRNLVTSGAPMSAGWRLSWKKM